MLDNQVEVVDQSTVNELEARVDTLLAQRAGKPRKVGVFKTMVECVTEGTVENPVSEKDIMLVLAQKFPERRLEGMYNSLQQLKWDCKHKLGLSLIVVNHHGMKGYYFSK